MNFTVNIIASANASTSINNKGDGEPSIVILIVLGVPLMSGLIYFMLTRHHFVA